MEMDPGSLVLEVLHHQPEVKLTLKIRLIYWSKLSLLTHTHTHTHTYTLTT